MASKSATEFVDRLEKLQHKSTSLENKAEKLREILEQQRKDASNFAGYAASSNTYQWNGPNTGSSIPYTGVYPTNPNINQPMPGSGIPGTGTSTTYTVYPMGTDELKEQITLLEEKVDLITEKMDLLLEVITWLQLKDLENGKSN